MTLYLPVPWFVAGEINPPASIFLIRSLAGEALIPVSDITVAADFKDCLEAFLLFFGITLGWFLLIPVTTERSISVYMLSYIDSLGKPIGKEEFERIFFDDYIVRHGS